MDAYFLLDQEKLLRVPLWIGHCHLCMEGYLNLCVQSL